MFAAIQPVLYVQISPEQLVVKNVKTGERISEVPELAISTGTPRRIVAVGPQARISAAGQAAEIVNPFAHPRSLVSDYVNAEQLLKHQVRRALGKSLLSIAPRIVIHPLGSPAGGFTQVERRAFHEMARGAGAAKANVWTGRALTDQEVLSGQAPRSGGEWE
jgi:rod shape-determining protein MreB